MGQGLSELLGLIESRVCGIETGQICWRRLQSVGLVKKDLPAVLDQTSWPE